MDREQQPQKLVTLLLDPETEDGERDDVAMLLGEFDDPAAEKALLRIALDQLSDAGLAESCAESLGEIWSRKDHLDPTLIGKLQGIPFILALGSIESGKPEWKEEIQKIRGQVSKDSDGQHL